VTCARLARARTSACEDVAPWSLAQAGMLGDATYGILDSTTILGY
jgi:hypothetical protein